MVNILDFRGETLSRRFLRQRLPRAAETHADVERRVAELLDSVAVGGSSVVADLTERFDGVRPETLRVPAEALAQAAADLDPEVRAALEETIERTRRVAADQVPTDVRTELGPGAEVTTRSLPIERVGLYVPGGLAVYPSTVVMNVVPAQAAGAQSLAIASPPQADGLPHPVVLATAHMLGVDEVWAMGGAQAIGALAYGFDDAEVLEPVDLITGPGNAYVAAAKSLVRSHVGIDAVAGPTEIIVLADATADPAFVAADLISQAEHDELAASVLVTDSQPLLEAVEAELERQVPEAAHAERIRTALAGSQSALVLVDDLDDAITVVNAYAGEHVEIHTADDRAVAARIVNGGAVFVGPYAPVSLGDYCAGSNHVLPTMGTAAHGSGLGVHSFLKVSQVIDYSRPALGEVRDHVVALARTENLPAHGRAVAIRFEE
ncbi:MULTISPECIES: histidinol dehydrogenase [Brevibacterium]|uniref:Histidinol dehydrogenase n=1 Tax=Brevibacterium casei TaxID=33889 RepID=A0A7T9TP80_9MICO|nr:histidinol dehydrogenase [Brevibacterium casei]NJE68157.1 histidinol dehydrogenase [Brevibacterium sp. LS14]MBE4695845.1 histidinol dehydrogenase [Brevibacterium casei]MBY3578967.1 histidinol dehydrogenase [Brevibacterium casei]MCT1552019.1 histidinol dehydrogenase [Brevibacterium casei]MCT1561839.1 histidinol dehydrogenase [Brevibacterium casei]